MSEQPSSQELQKDYLSFASAWLEQHERAYWSQLGGASMSEQLSLDELQKVYDAAVKQHGLTIARITMNSEDFDALKEQLESASSPLLWSGIEVVTSPWIPRNRIMRHYSDGTYDVLDLEDGTVSQRVKEFNIREPMEIKFK